MRKVDEPIDACAKEALEAVLTEDKDVLCFVAGIICTSPTPARHFIKNNIEGPRPLISPGFYSNGSRAKDAHIISLKGDFVARFSSCPFVKHHIHFQASNEIFKNSILFHSIEKGKWKRTFQKTKIY